MTAPGDGWAWEGAAMAPNRREILASLGATAIASTLAAPVNAGADQPGTGGRASRGEHAFRPHRGPRARVMIVNDLSGDIDGLFATVHALLSPSTDIRGIVGTAARAATETAERSVALATEMLRLMGRSGTVPVHSGVSRRLDGAATPVDGPGVRAIIAEAMRDSDLPLYVTVGGGLTEVASALMIEPRIAQRMTLVWIGGKAHDDGGPEYNFYLDRTAARYVFNMAQVPIFQVTSRAYSRCQVSNTELQANVAPFGAIGAWLYRKVVDASRETAWNAGETWTLGDSPLVALTALTSWVPNDFSGRLRYEGTSAPFAEVFIPRLDEQGRYEPRSEGRRMRVYDDVDTRLLFGDFFAKMRENYG